MIHLKYIEDSSVLVVLVGPKTYCRKHVDWEYIIVILTPNSSE
ncbi:MAG: TIR domain-containing protein [Methanotrichaceae archaeon]|nr:TIR domain-containing protein [Methanotrichaceae archaeon]